MDVALPWSGKKVSTQGKVYLATFAVGLVAEFIGEVILYKTIPDGRDNLKARFWARYVVGAALAVVMGSIGYISIEVLSASGWPKTAWLVAFIPTITFAVSAFMLQGMNTVLDTTSGMGCFGAIKAAVNEREQKSHQKKVCINDKQSKTA